MKYSVLMWRGSKGQELEVDFYIYISIPSRLDICTVEGLAGFGNLSSVFGTVWRFLPLMDPSVTKVIKYLVGCLMRDWKKD